MNDLQPVSVLDAANAPRGTAPIAAPPAAGRSAIVWDSTNTSAVVMARGLRRRGYTVHWIGSAVSPWRTSSAFDGEHVLIRGPEDDRLLQAFLDLPCDALFLCGDDHVRWALEHWDALPKRVHDFLSPPDSLHTALSKERSMALAARLGVPVLPTERCRSPHEVAVASRRLAGRGRIVLKGEGGAAGCAVASIGVGVEPDRATWERVTRFAPLALVQRRVTGPRVFMSVVYEHGIARALCMHEKIASFPFDFGPTAFAVTRHVPQVLADSHRLFAALGWHGIANIEFRQDLEDGRWYFMEINPRVAASMGIQDAAGIDVAATWTAICEGRGGENPPGAGYRDGVRFAWGVRGLALALRRPWSVPAWGYRCLLGGGSDLHYLDAPLRRRAARLALWMARHA